MTYKMIVRPEAEADVETAILWYEGQAKGLGARFLHEFEDCLHHISDTPEGFAKIRYEIRRALFRKFPYCIFYFLNEDTITILACLHARRDPNLWRERI